MTMQAAVGNSPRACGAFEARLSTLVRERRAGLFVPQAMEEEAAREPLTVVLFREHPVGRTRSGIARRADGLGGARLDGSVLKLPDDPEAFALALREAGLSQGWRGEALDLCPLGTVLDEDFPQPVGRLERAVFRPVGAVTRAVHLVGVTRPPEAEDDPVFLIGRRSRRKRIGPGLWDGLAAGMVQAGEAPPVALRREAAEEAGLLADVRLVPVTRFPVSRPVPEGWMREVSFAALAVLPEGFQPEAVDGEVERFACVSAEEIVRLVEAREMMEEAGLACLAAALALLFRRTAACLRPTGSRT